MHGDQNYIDECRVQTLFCYSELLTIYIYVHQNHPIIMQSKRTLQTKRQAIQMHLHIIHIVLRSEKESQSKMNIKHQ